MPLVPDNEPVPVTERPVDLLNVSNPDELMVPALETDALFTVKSVVLEI